MFQFDKYPNPKLSPRWTSAVLMIIEIPLESPLTFKLEHRTRIIGRADKLRSGMLSRLRAFVETLCALEPSFRRTKGPFDSGGGLTRKACKRVGVGCKTHASFCPLTSSHSREIDG